MVIELCVRGYHVYKDIWEAAIGEELPRERETSNTKDRCAVAVKKDDTEGSSVPNFARENICGPASTANTAKISTSRI